MEEVEKSEADRRAAEEVARISVDAANLNPIGKLPQRRRCGLKQRG